MAYESRIPYGLNQRKALQLVVVGFFASAVMTAFSYVFGFFKTPAPDFAAQYGSMLNEQFHPDPFSGPWWLGMFWHLLNGSILFPLLFDYLTHRGVLPSEQWTRGSLFGISLGLLNCILVAPLAGEGIFFRFMPNSLMMSVSSLICWALYGIALERLTRIPFVHQVRLSSQEAA